MRPPMRPPRDHPRDAGRRRQDDHGRPPRHRTRDGALARDGRHHRHAGEPAEPLAGRAHPADARPRLWASGRGERRLRAGPPEHTP
eukprot:5908231-Prymnesium_polylepis.1